MSFNFTIPVPKSKIKKKSEKNYEFEPSGMDDEVVSPYDGVIVNDDTHNSCSTKDLSFVIKHIINNEIYYSVICNVAQDPIYVPTGTPKLVSKGTEIGKTLNNDNVNYFIVNSNGNKQNISDFIGSKNTSKDGGNNKENDKNKKGGENKPPKVEVDPSKSGDDLITKWLLGVPKAAADVVKSGLSADKKREKKEENIKLKEDIERIKSLLK